MTLVIPPGRGGSRRGAGRKRVADRPMVSHGPRPLHGASNPVHVTMRVRRDIPSLRYKIYRYLREAIRLATRDSFAIIHYSVQSNHIHLIVEATDRRALSTGMQGFAIRAAKAINRALGRHGSVWADRFHARELTTPREVRNAISYVLLNEHKHNPSSRGIDPCSSGPWFDGWKDHRPRAHLAPPTVAARTWLLRIGWRKWGLIPIEKHYF